MAEVRVAFERVGVGLPSASNALDAGHAVGSNPGSENRDL